MRVSVVVAACNSAKTIEATLATVLAQTIPPDEVLILDDGSTDNTVSLLRSYEPRITILQQTNQGVSHARNTLCQQAAGDLIAFLDHDDLWHPRYLEVQRWLFENHPAAVAFFTGHVDFHGYGNHDWVNIPIDFPVGVELVDPLSFLRRYHQSGVFGSMSFCCVPKPVLAQIGKEPFCPLLSGVDDFHLFHRFILLGSVAYSPAPLVAYRITQEAQSANRLKGALLSLRAMELLGKRYRREAGPQLAKAFRFATDSKRRECAKLLMGAGRKSEARKHITEALRSAANPISLTKSFALWLVSWLPTCLQPAWPQAIRNPKQER